jgi:hypothetical protein
MMNHSINTEEIKFLSFMNHQEEFNPVVLPIRLPLRFGKRGIFSLKLGYLAWLKELNRIQLLKPKLEKKF